MNPLKLAEQAVGAVVNIADRLQGIDQELSRISEKLSTLNHCGGVNHQVFERHHLLMLDGWVESEETGHGIAPAGRRKTAQRISKKRIVQAPFGGTVRILPGQNRQVRFDFYRPVVRWYLRVERPLFITDIRIGQTSATVTNLNTRFREVLSTEKIPVVSPLLVTLVWEEL